MKLMFSVTIKDCEVQTFRCPGNGGQKVNKTSSGIRVIHHPSGARAESCETRSQLENKRLAFGRMANSDKFKLWAKLETSRLNGEPSVEQKVDSMMNPNNLKIEVLNENSKWMEVKK